jgi:hypothetical protein
MDNQDQFCKRVEALEQQSERLMHHARTVERRLRRWRGIACGMACLAC